MNEPQPSTIKLSAESEAKIAAGVKALPELHDRQVSEQKRRNQRASKLRAEIVKRTAPLRALDRELQMKAIPQQDLSTIRQAWSTPIDAAWLADSIDDWPTNPSLDDLKRDQRALGDGLFVWHGNNQNATMGLSAVLMADGVHMHGRAHWDGSSLVHAVVGATDFYGMGPEAIPPAPSNRFRSAPPGELWGLVAGATGYYHPLVAADDKWCKVDLVLRHSVLQSIGGTWKICAERKDTIRLIDLENVYGGGQSSFELRGFTPVPVLEYSIFSRWEPLFTQLEMTFVTGLEGDSVVDFGPSPDRGVLMRTFPWRIQGL